MKPTLIIVEDVESVRENLVSALSGDFEILAAVSDGEQAVEAYRRHSPQLVLMDVVMPRMSGIEATRIILEESHEHEPKIVMMSGLKDEAVVFQAMTAGAVDFLVKPMPAEKIREVLLSFAA